MMAQVTIYKVEVKYTGSLEDYTVEQLKDMADNRIYHGVDAYDHTEEVTEEEAQALDGRLWIDHKYPSNKLVDVCWIEKEEQEAEDDE